MNATTTKRKATSNRYDSTDILEEILSYLPCKSLLRFTDVCKQWESLFHDSQFRDKQRCRNMNHPSHSSHFLDFDYSSDPNKITLHMHEIGVDGYSLVKTVKTAVSKLYGLLQSSHGLVCLHGFSNRKLLVFNPNTEQVRYVQDYPEPYDSLKYNGRDEILSLPYFNRLGFGFDVKSKRYKVVQLVRDSKTHGISKCNVLTVDRFESRWREINGASLDCKVNDLFFPACVDGVIYWQTKELAPAKRICILMFDLRCEEIKMILAPAECMHGRFNLCGRHLVELQRKICFVDATRTIDKSVHMDIWMLIKDSNDVYIIGWAPMYKLELGFWCRSPYIFPMCMFGTRIILEVNGGMYCYDVEENCLKTYKGDGEVKGELYFKTLVHTETIDSLQ